MNKQTVDIDETGMVEVSTPDGLILITRLPGVGTQIMAYEKPDDNPVGYLNLKEQK